MPEHIEALQWCRSFYIPRPLPGFPVPTSVAVSEARSAVYRLPGWQRHSEVGKAVFQYSLAGTGSFAVDACPTPVPPGQGFLCQVGDPRICYYYPEEQRQPWRFLFLAFHDASDWVKTINAELGYIFSLEPAVPVLRRLLDYSRRRETTLEMSVGEAATLVSTLLTTLIDLARQDHVKDRNLQLVRQVYRLIDHNLFCAYNAGMLASDAQISQAHLNRIFRQETGLTPYQVILQKKMNQACLMLKDSPASCTAIAAALGFEPGTHFSRCFKRVIGMSPQVFRQRGIIH